MVVTRGGACSTDGTSCIPPPHGAFCPPHGAFCTLLCMFALLALCLSGSHQEADPSTHSCLGLHCAACVLSVGEGPESLSKHSAFCKLSSASTGQPAQQLYYLSLFWLSALRLQQFQDCLERGSLGHYFLVPTNQDD